MSEPTTPGKQAIVHHICPPRNRSVQPRPPEIDTERTLIARSSTGSVGPGERIGQRGGAGSISKPWRTERNGIPVRCGTGGHAERPGPERIAAGVNGTGKLVLAQFP